MGGGLEWFWNQWLYGTEIPTVRWSHEVSKEQGGWLVTVEAEQEETEFIMPIPVYVHVKGGKVLTTPLIMQGKKGTARALLREKPLKVTLNDHFETLVEIKD